MTARECLNGLRDMHIRLRRLERDIKEIRAKLYSLRAIDYSKERVTGGEPSDLAEQIAHFNAKLEQAQEEWRKLVAYGDAVDAMISRIPSKNLQALLHERYVNAGSWEQVAEVVGVSRQWVDRRMHPKALKEFERIFKKSLQEFTTVYI